MSKPFRIGLIGGGRMGRTHLRALAPSVEVEIVAVAEPSVKASAELQRKGTTVFASAEEMLATVALDGVLVAVPTPQHIQTARNALEAGLPVLCEKPFGLQSDAARQIGKLAADKGLALQIAYWRRFVPELGVLRSDIGAGRYGDIHLLVCSQWDEAPPPAAFRLHSGGIYIDMGVHEIDQMLWLLGQQMVEFQAYSHPTAADPEASNDVDSAQALAVLSGGTSAVISLGRFYAGGDSVSVQVFGAKDHTSFDVISPVTGEGPQLSALQAQAEAFARHARGDALCGTSAEEAAQVLDLAYQLTTAAGIDVLGAE